MSPFDLSRDDVDFDRLSQYLKALAHPGRLEILWLLRIPSSATDIVIRPRRRDVGLKADRPMSRQAITEHLQTLEDIGVVHRAPAPEGAAVHWSTSVPHVFALIEELRKLTAIRPASRVDIDATFAQDPQEAPAWDAGPKLVLVSGPWEGRSFPLTGDGPWTVGRSRSREISISYDPYVSSDHAHITQEGGAYRIATAPGTRNPTHVNFTPLAEGAARPLKSGDIVTLGRSLVVFQAE